VRVGFRMGIVALLIAFLLAGDPDVALACSCGWNGPFLVVAPRSRMVVRGKVQGYHGKGRAGPLAMDLEILEVACGETPTSSLRVWGGDGLLCRPEVRRFPVGSEWFFALDGPGSKPGMTPDCALSICGTFWLSVSHGMVRGCIDDPEDMNAAQEMDLAQFRKKLAASLTGSVIQRRARMRFVGEVWAGQSFERPFGSGFAFRLEPSPFGWTIRVRETGRDEDLSRLTPPFHFSPNPRDLEGWHFRNSDNTGPNEAGDRNVNAPGQLRDFIFSPEVGRTIQGPGATSRATEQEVASVRAFGRGSLRILDFMLVDLDPGKKASMAWMRFEVDLSWPDPSRADPEPACRPLSEQRWEGGTPLSF